MEGCRVVARWILVMLARRAGNSEKVFKNLNIKINLEFQKIIWLTSVLWSKKNKRQHTLYTTALAGTVPGVAVGVEDGVEEGVEVGATVGILGLWLELSLKATTAFWITGKCEGSDRQCLDWVLCWGPALCRLGSCSDLLQDPCRSCWASVRSREKTCKGSSQNLLKQSSREFRRLGFFGKGNASDLEEGNRSCSCGGGQNRKIKNF